VILEKRPAQILRTPQFIVIEILSPINKREPGLTKYRNKLGELRNSGVNVLEIDLLRRDARTLPDERLRGVPYRVSLTRAFEHKIEIWPVRLQDELPLVPVPLRYPDPDVPLDLSQTHAEVYDESAYDLSINYRESAPPPPLASEELEWM